MSKKNRVAKSFGYAGNGIKEAFQNEPNFRIHTVAAAISVLLAIYFQFSLIKFSILILTITMVIILELVNTAIEKVVDKASPSYSRLAKVAKDVSAAAVLVAAIGAILVGAMLFLPNILQLLSVSVHLNTPQY